MGRLRAPHLQAIILPWHSGRCRDRWDGEHDGNDDDDDDDDDNDDDDCYDDDNNANDDRWSYSHDAAGDVETVGILAHLNICADDPIGSYWEQTL